MIDQNIYFNCTACGTRIGVPPGSKALDRCPNCGSRRVRREKSEDPVNRGLENTHEGRLEYRPFG